MIARFDTTDFTSKIAGEVKDFDCTQYVDKKEGKRIGCFVHYAIAASKMAIADAELDLDKVDRDRIGTSYRHRYWWCGNFYMINITNHESRTSAMSLTRKTTKTANGLQAGLQEAGYCRFRDSFSLPRLA